jgi:hypothetical protein
VGRVHAIGFALAVSLVASGPALAPSPSAAVADTPAPCDPRTPYEIALDCDPATFSHLDNSFLALDALAPTPLEARAASLPAYAEGLRANALAPIPPPVALLTLALGLGALATLRRVAYCG